MWEYSRTIFELFALKKKQKIDDTRLEILLAKRTYIDGLELTQYNDFIWRALHLKLGARRGQCQLVARTRHLVFAARHLGLSRIQCRFAL